MWSILNLVLASHRSLWIRSCSHENLRSTCSYDKLKVCAAERRATHISFSLLLEEKQRRLWMINLRYYPSVRIKHSPPTASCRYANKIFNSGRMLLWSMSRREGICLWITRFLSSRRQTHVAFISDSAFNALYESVSECAHSRLYQNRKLSPWNWSAIRATLCDSKIELKLLVMFSLATVNDYTQLTPRRFNFNYRFSFFSSSHSNAK